jgi:hypothetical protein
LLHVDVKLPPLMPPEAAIQSAETVSVLFTPLTEREPVGDWAEPLKSGTVMPVQLEKTKSPTAAADVAVAPLPPLELTGVFDTRLLAVQMKMFKSMEE